MAKNVKMKKKRDKRVSALDVVIVLLIIGLIAAFAYRVYDGIADPVFKKSSQYTVSFVCDEEYNSVAKYLSDGEAVYIASTGELLGNLYAKKAGEPVITVSGGTPEIQPDAGTETGTDAGTGEEVATESQEPLYEKVVLSGNLKLSADAEMVSAGNYYTVGGINIVGGSVIEVYTEDAVFTLTVAAITPIQ